MKLLTRFYHFLGGIYFAIGLIATATLFVIVGTLIESKTESHRYAAHFTYGNPLFIALLWLFFVNILLAALRRWPFKIKHIPFLITHWGLLMLLAGSLAKSYYGVQGSMEVIEGSASQELYLPDTYVIKLEKRPEKNELSAGLKYYQLKHSLMHGFERILSAPSDELEISLIEYAPHSSERLESWIKGEKVYITGLKPLAVYDWQKPLNETISELPISSRVKVNANLEHSLWNLYAFSTADVSSLAKQLYLQQLEVVLTDQKSQKELFRGSLAEGLFQPIVWQEKRLSLHLHFEFSAVVGLENPLLRLNVQNNQKLEESLIFPLNAQDGFLEPSSPSQQSEKNELILTLHKTPAIAFVKDRQEDLFVLAFDSKGRIHSEAFRADNFNSLIAYEGGRGGYALQFGLPFPETKGVFLESRLTAYRKNEIPQKKLEDNLPKITIKIKKGARVEYATLTYDRYGQGLKWPVFDGEYLVRFQPLFQKIPYSVRLRRARQISYAHSSQPYSYESDLIIKDLKNNQVVEKTISMNNVYETWEGYRFYLSNLSSANESSVKRIQIVVNHDPTKYLLTYPGAIILSVGIFLLFWVQPYRKKY